MECGLIEIDDDRASWLIEVDTGKSAISTALGVVATRDCENQTLVREAHSYNERFLVICFEHSRSLGYGENKFLTTVIDKRRRSWNICSIESSRMIGVIALRGTTLMEVILVKGQELPTKVNSFPVGFHLYPISVNSFPVGFHLYPISVNSFPVGCDLLALVELFNPVKGNTSVLEYGVLDDSTYLLMLLEDVRGTDISQKDEKKPSKKRQNRTRDGKVCEDEAQSKSSELHWTAVKNILKYLRNTKDMFLVYGGNPSTELRVECYCDAGFETDRDDMKSQTGYVFVLNGGIVDWKSSKQSTIAMSATESEYIAASEAAMEAGWIRKFISGLGIVPTINEPINMYCDNSAAVHYANELGVQTGARHYLRKYHYVRESVALGEIKILKLHTDNNLADPFTKALSNRKLTQHARSMGSILLVVSCRSVQ
ncbi:hypothetical protein Tco_0723480 [Tanacetum coccineum]